LRAALADHAIAPLSAEVERTLLGPPFYETLPPLIGADRFEAVLSAYRRHYSAGLMYDTKAYPGIAELVAALPAAGTRLALATSKPEEQATLVLDRLGFAGAFTVVCGDTADGRRRTKALVIAEALRRLGRPDPAQVVMVGDRAHDVLGAAEHRIACLGAGWGYGAPGELSAAGAQAVFATAAELAGYWAAGAEPAGAPGTGLRGRELPAAAGGG
jgi:phosphoglycolate phosphatase